MLRECLSVLFSFCASSPVSRFAFWNLLDGCRRPEFDGSVGIHAGQKVAVVGEIEEQAWAVTVLEGERNLERIQAPELDEPVVASRDEAFAVRRKNRRPRETGMGFGPED